MQPARTNASGSEQGPPRSEAVFGCPHAYLPHNERGGRRGATQGLFHRMPVSLWVCKLRRQRGRCMHCSMLLAILLLCQALSMGCKK